MVVRHAGTSPPGHCLTGLGGQLAGGCRSAAAQAAQAAVGKVTGGQIYTRDGL